MDSEPNNVWRGSARVIYISGVWDLLHDGHRNVLEKARALGDFLVVGVNTDEFVRSYKDKPVRSFMQRCEDIAALPCVDVVVRHDGFMDMTGFEKYGVDVRAVGPEFGRYEEQRKCLAELEERGIEIVKLSRTPDISTIILKERGRK